MALSEKINTRALPGRIVLRARGIKYLLPVLFLHCLLVACEAPRYKMITGVESASLETLPVWPRSADTPRYRFAGVLYGEQNLQVMDGDAAKSNLKKIFNWVVGLFNEQNVLQLQSPQGGVVDENGVIYVTDVTNGGIFVFNAKNADESGDRLLVWHAASLSREFIAPISIALGPDQQLLVTDAELAEVFRLDRSGQPLGSFGKGILNRPTGIARDPNRGEIYVSDTQDHDIKVFDDSGQFIRSVGSRGTLDGHFNFPIHITFVRDKLYVVDSMNARIQIFDPLGTHLQSFGERGKYLGMFSRPKGVAVDSEDNIYVIDSYFDYLLVFNKQGEFLLPIGGTGEEIGSFYLPAGVWIDSHDQIHVADLSNGRVVLFHFLGGD